MLIANRLVVPDGTGALLWDMDGVLLDTLTMDYELVNRLLRSHAPGVGEVPRQVVRAYFPYDIPDFWRLLVSRIGLDVPQDTLDELVREHEKARESAEITIHDGVAEILADARDRGLRAAVVSNNPAADVDRMLRTAGLRDYFAAVIGNDDPAIEKKPAPDAYLEAVRRMAGAGTYVALEDSLLGAQAAKAAGCWTVGVATGATDFEALSSSPHVDSAYAAFIPCRIEFGREGVTKKSLVTPNEFVSHMIEHIAWRLGCSVDVLWTNDDWFQLGRDLGQRIGELVSLRGAAASLGMIDDGSCEVALRRDSKGNARLRSVDQVDLDWFLALRCEQLRNGQPLVRMLHGLGAGCGVDLDILVTSVEDPHHTWEGIFRGVGIGLSKLAAVRELPEPADDARPSVASHAGQPTRHEASVERGWNVWHSSPTAARLRRETAESVVDLELELGNPGAEFALTVSDSISVGGVSDLLREFAQAAGLHVTVRFNATRLSSSHVVTEDIGLALGRALRCVAVERMVAFGINGAGSSIGSVDDLTSAPIRVGVSMEGRKFWKFVPLNSDYASLRKAFLIGHTLPNGLFSEDLDDFIDGFAGGLGASVMIHVDSGVDPAAGWQLVFGGLGSAMKELLAHNPDRRALAPGVKATLA